MENIFEKFMQLPLFQGISLESLHRLVESTPLHFLKFQPNEVLASADQQCKRVIFLLSGTIEISVQSKVHELKINQEISAPNIIGAEYLFGRHTIYPFTAVAKSHVSSVQIRKADFIKILQKNEIFLMNTLNYLSRNLQNSTTTYQHLRYGRTIQRIVQLVNNFTYQQAKNITIHYRQKDICDYLGSSRSSLLAAIEELTERGLIEVQTNSLVVKDRAGCIKLLKE